MDGLTYSGGFVKKNNREWYYDKSQYQRFNSLSTIFNNFILSVELNIKSILFH